MSLNSWAIKKIESYQKNKAFHKTKKCRFTPTCSEYGKECYKRFGFIRASFYTALRIIRCNPLSKMKYDPVPEIKNIVINGKL